MPEFRRAIARAPRLCGALFLLVLAGCSGYREVRVIGLRGVQVDRFDAQGLSARVSVEIDNPNPYRIRVKDPDVDLYVNDLLLGKATLDSTVVLERRAVRTYALPLHADFQGQQMNLLPLLLMAATGSPLDLAARGSVVGKAGLLRRRFPFEVAQRIDLRDTGLSAPPPRR